MSICDTPEGCGGSLPGDASSQALTRQQLEGMTVNQIKVLVADTGGAADASLRALLEQDGRAGVRHLAVQLSRRQQRQEAERARLARLLALERRLWGRGVVRVAGVDEVGRGCLAGPVMAAAVVFPRSVEIPGLDDSKKLTPDRREQLLDEIGRQAEAVGVGRVEAADIDRLNILQASLEAMRRALVALECEPQHVLVDGKHTPGSGWPETGVVNGDGRSLSIAAASVVAKVHRDRLMVEYSDRYPEYGFASHKGYGSAEHLRALREHGPSPLHRRSFGPVAALIGEPRSAAFRVFAEGLESARSPAELRRLGRFVREGAGELSPPELTALRRLYATRQRQLDATGPRGEEAAAAFLGARGYAVLERGYRGAGGEIDLVVRRGNCVVFVEVKSSGERGMGHPEARVGRAKQARLVRAARHYRERHREADLEYRFDVVAVSLVQGTAEVSHFEGAFMA